MTPVTSNPEAGRELRTEKDLDPCLPPDGSYPRAGKLRPADIADATFTISNLGMYHVDQFSAIITPPQAAILAVAAIVDRVVVVEGKPAVRPTMTLTVSCDHRVADGARAALFLNDLAGAVGEPEKSLA